MTPLVSRDRFDAFVFDLDGTLLDGAARLTDRTVRAVRALKAAGYVVVLATGRSLAGAREVHDALGLDTQICAYNGAFIGGHDGLDPWHYAPIPDAALADLRTLERGARFLFRHTGERKFTARAAADDLHRRVAAWYTNVEHVEGGPAALPSRDLVRVSLFFEGAEAVEAAWADLPPAAREALHRETFPMAIFPGFDDVALHLCEVQRRGNGKAEVYRYLLERHGIGAHRVVAVGDQRNDLSLLRDAGLPVAMGNAVEELRALARLVIGDHRDDGVARFLEEHVLAVDGLRAATAGSDRAEDGGRGGAAGPASAPGRVVVPRGA